MSKTTRLTRLVGAALLLPGLVNPAAAATLTATNCSEAAVQAAINSAGPGDTVTVPAGHCTWNGFAIARGIHVQGAGAALLTVTVSGSMRLSKNTQHSIELSGFTFRKNGNGVMFYVDGAWSAAPPLLHDNVFTVTDATILRYETNGGVIYRNQFNGGWNDVGIQHKMVGDTQSWSSADTLGRHDATGQSNLYIEDNTFNGMSNAATDFDDGARVVFRHNRLTNASFNSHGVATSAIGVRHYEIYNNRFSYPDRAVNQNWWIWLRGGTGVIYNNHFDDITGMTWGEKAELLLSVRAANDGGILGCASHYPALHQVGQNHNGNQSFTDPVVLWNNSGTLAYRLQEWPNQCGQAISGYLQAGRDFIFATAPKPGYVAYPYPHPLTTQEPPTMTLQAPGNLRIVP